MTKDQAGSLDTLLSEKGFESEVKDDYSGRGMYGKTTYAVDTSASPKEAIDSINNALKEDPEGWDLPKVENLEWDSLGLNYVIY